MISVRGFDFKESLTDPEEAGEVRLILKMMKFVLSMMNLY